MEEEDVEPGYATARDDDDSWYARGGVGGFARSRRAATRLSRTASPARFASLANKPGDVLMPVSLELTALLPTTIRSPWRTSRRWPNSSASTRLPPFFSFRCQHRLGLSSGSGSSSGSASALDDPNGAYARLVAAPLGQGAHGCAAGRRRVLQSPARTSAKIVWGRGDTVLAGLAGLAPTVMAGLAPTVLRAQNLGRGMNNKRSTPTARLRDGARDSDTRII